MSTGTGIEWTQATWNPVTGCTRVSAGCDHCYAVAMTHRLESMGQVEKYGGLTVLNNRGDRHFNGQVRTHEDALAIPLRRRKPTMYFVNSMSDLFHRDVPFEFIDRVFAVMALCPRHTFQILTKRPERMVAYLARSEEADDGGFHRMCTTERLVNLEAMRREYRRGREAALFTWPLRNVWLGTSCENQEAADQRIPHLLKCPAAVRFLSCEPLLGWIDLSSVADDGINIVNPLSGNRVIDGRSSEGPSVQWVIVGGESGPDARSCDVAWIRAIVEDCFGYDVPCFVKQLGSCIDGQIEHPSNDGHGVKGVRLKSPKGGEMSEWPEDLRVREMPEDRK